MNLGNEKEEVIVLAEKPLEKMANTGFDVSKAISENKFALGVALVVGIIFYMSQKVEDKK